LLEELITKLVPATMDAVGADNIPGVPPGVFAVRNILEEAVTAVVLMVTDPAVMATDVPTEALDPVAIESLLPAVPNTKFPFVAVIAPKVAVRVVEAVRDPVTSVFPVAFPMLVAPVPPVPIVVVAEPLVFIVVAPTALSVVACTGRGVVLPKPSTGGDAKSSAVAESAVAGDMYTLVRVPVAASVAVAARTVEFCVVGVPVTPGG
jgi:hypothetical protein